MDSWLSSWKCHKFNSEVCENIYLEIHSKSGHWLKKPTFNLEVGPCYTF